jgi:Rod binding domain-containing protein
MQIASMNPERMAGDGGGVAPQPRLVRAAHEFEAMMMKELLKPMTGSDDPGAGVDDPDAGGGVLGEFESEALGQGLSRGGGFGIANQIVHSLSHSGTTFDSGKVTGNLHRDTQTKSRG